MYDYFMEKLVWQKFILGTDNLDYILEKEVGGIIFFTKDILSKNQFVDLIKDIKSKSKSPMFLSIDQEGGRVERTENISPKRLSAKYAYEKGEEFLKKQSEEISKELADYGINLNFAPCIDVNTNKNNPIIGERAFSDNPEDVIKGMNIFVEASKKYGIIPQTIKKPIENNLLSLVESYRSFEDIVAEEMVDLGIDKKDLPKLISKLEKDMHKAAKILDFERAAEIRDQLKKLREMI